MNDAANATDRRRRRWLMALILINVALTPLSFIPADPRASTTIRILAFLAVLGALALAGATLSLPRMTGWKRRTAVGVPLVAAFVAGAIAFGIITSASTSDAVGDDAFQIDMTTNSSPTIPASQIVVSPSDATSAAAIQSAAAIAGDLSVIEGVAGQRLVAAAQNSNYTSRRGGTLDWEGAVAERSTTMRLVTIPFVGTDFPEIDKIVFMLAGQTAMVVEFSAQIVDESTMNFRVWQNGAAARNVDIVDPTATSDSSIAQVWSWGVFNSCMSSAGFSMWLLGAIGLACAAICIGTAGLGCYACLAFAAGGYSGVLLTCYNRARRA